MKELTGTEAFDFIAAIDMENFLSDLRLAVSQFSWASGWDSGTNRQAILDEELYAFHIIVDEILKLKKTLAARQKVTGKNEEDVTGRKTRILREE